MKKGGGLVAHIISMITVTAVIICIAVSVAGSLMIYVVGEQGTKNEVQYAARTLYNICDMNYHGEYYYEEQTGVLKKGGQVIDEDAFDKVIDNIGTSSDMDFTLLWGDTRVLTSVTDDNGVSAVGTQVSDAVVARVLEQGLEYVFSDVNVNGTEYVGCYIPVLNSGAKTVGMVFAGKPLKVATETTRHMTLVFIGICVTVLIVSLTVAVIYSRRIVMALDDIKRYMGKISVCDFTYALAPQTLERTDEIGDIGKSAIRLCDSLRGYIERDPLTGLLNRRSGRIAIEGIIAKGSSYCVAMGDIDFFKRINDTYGHAAGDLVLKGISAILGKGAMAYGGSVARWGGEEFLLIFPNMEISGLMNCLNGIQSAVRGTSFPFEGSDIRVTMTFGGVMQAAGETIDQTVNRADKLLYEGKQTGRNKIVT